MKTLIHVALLASLAAPLAWSAGTVKVYTPDSEKPKTLTHAEHLLDLVGQPRLANSWWPGAVIAERQKTVEAEQQHKALLARLTGLAEQEDGDDGGAGVVRARAARAGVRAEHRPRRAGGHLGGADSQAGRRPAVGRPAARQGRGAEAAAAGRRRVGRDALRRPRLQMGNLVRLYGIRDW